MKSEEFEHAALVEAWLKEPIWLPEIDTERTAQLIHLTPQQRGWLRPFTTRRSHNMFTALKVVAAGIVLAMVGGFLITTMTLPSRDGEQPAGRDHVLPPPVADPSSAPEASPTGVPDATPVATVEADSLVMDAASGQSVAGWTEIGRLGTGNEDGSGHGEMRRLQAVGDRLVAIGSTRAANEGPTRDVVYHSLDGVTWVPAAIPGSRPTIADLAATAERDRGGRLRHHRWHAGGAHLVLVRRHRVAGGRGSARAQAHRPHRLCRRAAGRTGWQGGLGERRRHRLEAGRSARHGHDPREGPREATSAGSSSTSRPCSTGTDLASGSNRGGVCLPSSRGAARPRLRHADLRPGRPVGARASRVCRARTRSTRAPMASSGRRPRVPRAWWPERCAGWPISMARSRPSVPWTGTRGTRVASGPSCPENQSSRQRRWRAATSSSTRRSSSVMATPRPG